MAALALLEGEGERLTRKCIEMALEGDVTAMRLCLTHILPRSRVVPIDLPLRSVADLNAAGEVIRAALAQQHHGRGMDAQHLPQSWASTANDIEATLFAAKDALAVVDDFAPGTARGNRQELEGKAERVVRGLGNAAGRGRMTADGRQHPARPEPR